MKNIIKYISLLLALLCMAALSACQKQPNGEEKPTGEAYSFLQGGVAFQPGEKASVAFSAWKGAAPAVSAKGSCLGGVDGEDVTYKYEGFRIQTFRKNADDPDEVIRWVILDDDSVQTQKGIAIGAAASAVKAAYGTPTEESDSLYRYIRGGTILAFNLREGKVTSVSYRVNDQLDA